MRGGHLLWTEQSREHIARHGVSPADVEFLLGRPAYVERGAKHYYVYRGQDRQGRFLLVVLDDLGDGRYYVVTARPLKPRERRTLLRKRRLRR